MLTQEFKDEKGKAKQHPICYVSRQFRGSQQNWAVLTKEAYAIYMSVCTFGGSARILTDNGTEFKNDQFNQLCKQLDIKRGYSPVYTPKANG